jgi:histidinol-phosphate/aromatic aminotransferase/cobyric acid decarboxylase-like protein
MKKAVLFLFTVLSVNTFAQAFESFNFIMNSRKSEEIERKQFKAALPISYLKSDRLKTNFNTTINDKISINSDWISEEQSILLEQLATSPVIYLERSSTNFVAVNITNQNYEIKKYLDDRKLFNLSFDIEYTYSRYRQSL